MSQELQKPEVSLVPNYETGELIDLNSADSGDIAHALFAIRTKEQELREFKHLIGTELLDRMDRNAAWSMHAGAFDIKGSSPAPTKEVDLEPLREVLIALVDERKISAEAAGNALEQVVTYKPKWGGINAIRKISPEIRERIDKHIREVEKKRSIPSVQMRAS